MSIWAGSVVVTDDGRDAYVFAPFLTVRVRRDEYGDTHAEPVPFLLVSFLLTLLRRGARRLLHRTGIQS